MPSQRLVRAAAYVVCIHDDQILLSHQVSAGPAQGKWTLPSDGIERHGIRILYAASFPDSRPTPVGPDDGEIDDVGWFACDGLPEPITEWAALAVRVSRSS